MGKFSFDGYCLGQFKPNSILRGKRLVLVLTQQQINNGIIIIVIKAFEL